MRSVRTSTVELAVEEQGSGPALVLVHGFPLDHSMWDEQLFHFSKSHRVVAPDLRGFGKSQVVAGTSSMEQMADDLAAMLDAMQIREPVVLAGLSMGGYVAFQFWRKYADRLRGLVLCDTRAIADTPEAAKGRYALADNVQQNGAKIVADAMLPKLFGPGDSARQKEIAASTRGVIENTSPQGIAAALGGLATRPDVTGLLATIKVPTLVVVGQHDVISPVDEMRTIAAGIPGSQFVVIPDAGHMAPLENPKAFNEALDTFLTRVKK